MDKFINVTLHGISKLNHLLNDVLVDDPNMNFDKGKHHQELIDEIDGCITNFLDSVDASENHGYSEMYRSAREQKQSVSVLLGRQRKYLSEKLKEFRKEYIAECHSRLFSLEISKMTGKEFNEYLQLIGLLK